MRSGTLRVNTFALSNVLIMFVSISLILFHAMIQFPVLGTFSSSAGSFLTLFLSGLCGGVELNAEGMGNLQNRTEGWVALAGKGGRDASV